MKPLRSLGETGRVRGSWNPGWLSRPLAAGAIALATTAVVLGVLFALASGDTRSLLSHQALTPFITIGYAIIGARVAARAPRNPIGWIALAIGLLSAVNVVAIVFQAYTPLLMATPLRPATDLASWLNGWVWIPVVFLPLTFLLMLFPDGRLPSPRWRPVAWSAGLGLAGTVLALALHPGPLESWGTGTNPYGLDALAPAADLAAQAGQGLLILGLIGSLGAFFVRFRRSKGLEREQMKWLAYAASYTLLSLVVSGVLWFAWPDAPLVEEVGIALTSLSLLGIAAAAGLAILRHRLYDIDLVINRTLVYGTLTAGVVAIYVLLVGGVSVGLQMENDLAGALLTTVLVAVLYRPVLGRIQLGVDRLMGVGAETLSHPQEASTAQERLASAPASRDEVAPSRAHRLARRAWWLAAALAMGIFLAALPAYALNLGQGPPDVVAAVASPRYVFAMDLLAAIASVVAAALSLALAVLLFKRKRDDRMALFTSYYLLSFGVLVAGPLEELDAYWPGFYRAAQVPPTALGVLLTVTLVFLFPTGRFVPRWTRWVALASIVLLPTFFRLPLFGPTPAPSPFVPVISLAWLAILGTGVYAQVYRYRRVSTRVERQQVRWVLFGLALWLVVMFSVTGPYTLRQSLPPEAPMPWWVPVSEVAWFVGMNILPAALAVAVLRYRLWDLDVVINRTVVFGALTVAILALYGLVVGALGLAFQASGNLLASLIATGLAAVLFQPVRVRLQRAVNRMMYGERDDPYMLLTRLSRQLETSLSPEATLPTIVETIAKALKLPYAAIALREGADFEVAASYGLPPAGARQATVETLPLTYQNQTTGRLLLAPRAPDEPFSPTELGLLEDLARQVGVAAHNVRLASDLRRSYRQLVTTREEERLRIRRDLHDGLGPRLASLTLKLEAARNLLKTDPDSVDALLVEIKKSSQAAIGDIRRLVYDLRPPALDELGLVEALREHVATIRSPTGPHLTLEAPEPLPAVPAAVELAAYRIVLEALTNVVRHADARTCTVRFAVDDSLYVEVCDDGVGLPGTLHPGVGLTSIRTRTEELGGTCVIEPAPGSGTRVHVRIPLQPDG